MDENYKKELFAFEEIISEMGTDRKSKAFRFLLKNQHVVEVPPSELPVIGSIIKNNPSSRAYYEQSPHYWATEKGFRWWAETKLFPDWHRCDPRKLILLEPTLSVRGIGGFYVSVHGNSKYFAHATKGIGEGLLRLESYDWGHPAFWGLNASLRFSLTKAGFDFFSSLPRLEEAW